MSLSFPYIPFYSECVHLLIGTLGTGQKGHPQQVIYNNAFRRINCMCIRNTNGARFVSDPADVVLKPHVTSTRRSAPLNVVS